MLEILTPMNKVERVSRQVDPATFVAAPGVWAFVDTDGSLKNIASTVNNKLNKLVIGSASTDKYESHDIEVGRITTMESHGARCKVDTVGYTGSPSQGDMMVVSSALATLGKLISTSGAVAGTYEIVARCEEIDSVSGTMVFRTLSPVMITKS